MAGSEASSAVDILQTPEMVKDPVGITITHHLPDYSDEQYPWLSLKDGKFSNKCHGLKEKGADSLKFDARWKHIRPDKKFPVNQHYLDRISEVFKIQEGAGLGSIVVLSSAPKWALELARNNPEQFKTAYKSYIDCVFKALSGNGQGAPQALQIFNELNMSSYTPPELLRVIPDCIAIVNRKSQEYFHKHIPLVATLQAFTPSSKSIPKFSTGVELFIDKNYNLLQQFDEIKVDYYPGIWHHPRETRSQWWKNRDYFLKALIARNNPDKTAQLNHPIGAFNAAFGNMDLLKRVLKKLKPIQDMGKKIGIGEIGIPSIVPFDTQALGHEQLQAYGIGVILRNLKPLVIAHNLTEVGVYQLMDEPKPEVGIFNWGLFRKDGTPKRITDQNSANNDPLKIFFSHIKSWRKPQ